MAENSLKKWFLDFKKRREEIVRAGGLSSPHEIADYFTYSKMVANHPDFCPLYKSGKVCHNMSKDELVCYFCACPYYDYEYYNEERKEYGRCLINSKYGRRNEWGYWDCTNCLLPHRRKFVEFYLSNKSKT